MKTISDSVVEKAKRIRFIISDNDGVFTNGKFGMLGDGNEIYTFDTRDGLAVKIWLQLFGEDSFAVISGRDSDAVKIRARQLGIKHVFCGVKNKSEKTTEIIKTFGLSVSEVAAFGDDIQDLGMLEMAGYSSAPADAQKEVLEYVDYTSPCNGGDQAVRDMIRTILIEQNKWDAILKQKSF